MKKLHPDLIKEAYRLAASQPQAVVTVWDSDGICHYASPSLREVQGFEPEEMIGRHYSAFMEESDLRHAALARSDTDLTSESTITVFVRTKSGRQIRILNHSRLWSDPDSGHRFYITRTVLPNDS